MPINLQPWLGYDNPAGAYYSLAVKTGDGSTTNWDFNFAGPTPGYLDQAHVKALVINDDGTGTLATYTWVTSTRISISPAVPAGRFFCIFRDTPKATPLVNYLNNGALVSSENLSKANLQSLYYNQEVLDRLYTMSTSDSSALAIATAAQAAAAAAQAAAATSAAAASSSANDAATALAAVNLKISNSFYQYSITGGTFTLSDANVLSNRIIRFVGALASSAQFKFARDGDWLILNDTTGPGVLTVVGTDATATAVNLGNGSLYELVVINGINSLNPVATPQGVVIPRARNIAGDWGSTTSAGQRTRLTSSTVNDSTSVTVVPNGTSNAAEVVVYNSTSVDNTSLTAMGVNATMSYLTASRTGTGTFLPLSVQVGGAERLRVLTNGRLGIGTAGDNGAKLQVAAATGEACLGCIPAGTATAISITHASVAASNSVLFANPNGTVGGIVTTGSSVAYNTASDHRLKTPTGPKTDSLSIINAIPVYDGYWNYAPDQPASFVLAHELQAAYPYAVTGDKDAVSLQTYWDFDTGGLAVDGDGNLLYRESMQPQQVDYSRVVTPLIGAVQTLTALVASLRNEVNALKGI